MVAKRAALKKMAPERADASLKADPPFWKAKSLAEMTTAEWESLCDGCGKCCLLKLEYEDSGEIDHTNVACRLLDLGSCRCRNYRRRKTLVPDCIRLTADMVGSLSWLPATCAYRLIDEGRELYWWHPLISGDPETVHLAGVSIRGRAVGEEEVDDIEDYIVDWVE